MSMRDLAERALDAATRNGITYADVRVEEARERHITTKNAKPGTIATYESMGVGIRVISNGCWGFAATDEISPKGLERAANLAIEIAPEGDRARATAYLLVMISKDGQHRTLPPGRYECELAKHNGSWRFTRRVVLHDHDYQLDGI